MLAFGAAPADRLGVPDSDHIPLVASTDQVMAADWGVTWRRLASLRHRPRITRSSAPTASRSSSTARARTAIPFSAPSDAKQTTPMR